MAKKKDPDKKKLRPDAAEIAYRTMLEATGQAPKTVPPSKRTDEQKDPEAMKRGKKGGEMGGKARKESLTPERRTEIARKAARARHDSADNEDADKQS